VKGFGMNSYKWRTVVGYWGLGAICFITGLIYALIPSNHLHLNEFYGIFWEKIGSDYNGLVFALSVSSSIGFFVIFFKIKDCISEIYSIFKEIEKGTDDEFYEGLRERCFKIGCTPKIGKYLMCEKTEKKIENGLKCSLNKKITLLRWLRLKRTVMIWTVLYSVICSLMLILVFMFSSGWRSALFYASYVIYFLVASWFYAILFCSLRIKSFTRLSFYVLYPTILTIAVNIYYGLASRSLLSFDISAIRTFILLLSFFVLTAIFELFSYSSKFFKKKKHSQTNGVEVENNKEKDRDFSTLSFLCISFSIFLMTVFFFWYFGSNSSQVDYFSPYASLLFGVAVALFLGIFEGWDSLSQMKIDHSGKTFVKHYRWWNFLQICYPLAFFFVASVVYSEIFSFGLVLLFALVSMSSLIIWKRGGQQKDYSVWGKDNKWRKYKFWMGLITVGVIIINRIVFTNVLQSTIWNNGPINIDSSHIGVEFLLVLFGVVSVISMLWEKGKDAQNKALMIAVPLWSSVRYNDFQDFNRKGYIYDFTIYIFLGYLLISHVLLFGSGLIPRASGIDSLKNQENSITIIILLTSVIYMFLSFISKARNNKLMEVSNQTQQIRIYKVKSNK
jgi:hypothetical protein